MMLRPLHSAVPKISFGPVLAGWGSWDWLGADTARELSRYFDVQLHDKPNANSNVHVVIKHPPQPELAFSSRAPRIIYCPVDYYGSVREIDRNGWWLRKCARIVVHCERLRKYFEPYARVEYIDHHVKYVVVEQRARPNDDGPLLWVGVRSNLPPLLEWLKVHSLPAQLVVLTNGAIDQDAEVAAIAAVPGVNVETWTPELHRELAMKCRAALDIKGAEFRQMHKPPTKALDFIAAGLPVALNSDSSSAEHLRRLGFEPADPDEPDRWLSQEYWEETQRFGQALRELLSLERVGMRWRRLIEEVSAEANNPADFAVSTARWPEKSND